MEKDELVEACIKAVAEMRWDSRPTSEIVNTIIPIVAEACAGLIEGYGSGLKSLRADEGQRDAYETGAFDCSTWAAEFVRQTYGSKP